jgi:hypothetical protein
VAVDGVAVQDRLRGQEGDYRGGQHQEEGDDAEDGCLGPEDNDVGARVVEAVSATFIPVRNWSTSNGALAQSIPISSPNRRAPPP